jgi:hypothetical protein
MAAQELLSFGELREEILCNIWHPSFNIFTANTSELNSQTTYILCAFPG